MNKELTNIRYQLIEISEEEATKLYRLANNLKSHGGSAEVVAKIREEANELHLNAYPERLLDPFKTWEYAFKF
jgi:hypothetical protein